MMQSAHSSHKYDRTALIEAIAAGLRPKYLLFWGHTPKSNGIGKHVLSQWWPASFKADGESYVSAEHFMMAEKAPVRRYDDAAGHSLDHQAGRRQGARADDCRF
jgi:predicted NAD-dependent protein-ADP-ribosyltransferase YbiA (DUF1768 family)